MKYCRKLWVYSYVHEYLLKHKDVYIFTESQPVADPEMSD